MRRSNRNDPETAPRAPVERREQRRTGGREVSRHRPPTSTMHGRASDRVAFSRLKEGSGVEVTGGGVSLAEVRDLLGHANISQTSTYLKSTATSLVSAIEKLERYQQQLAEMHQQAAEMQAAAGMTAHAPGVVPVPQPERIQ